MNVVQLAEKRCSIRSYADIPVEAEKLQALLEAARLAPSAVNFQPWYFVVVKQEAGRQKMQACYPRDWFRSAPLYILVCADHNESWKRAADGKDHADIDAAIAAEHICLAAAELGLGTCWVCNFDTELCKSSFNLPEGVEPVVILPTGYPADPALFDTTPKKRKSLEVLVKEESF